MKKILFVATITRHIMSFHLPYLKRLSEMGYEVHVASNNKEYKYIVPYADKVYDIPFSRSPFSKDNRIAYKNLSKIIEDEKYNVIHCHTPIASALTRLCSKKSKSSKIIYTAHGFHFYKGASLFNWFTYFPIEVYLAKKTDTIITINEEDFTSLKFLDVKNKKLINGVGVDEKKYKPVNEEDKKTIRKTLNIPEDSLTLFYAAELNKNKNQIFLLKSIVEIIKSYPNLLLILAGEGNQKEKLKKFCRDNKIERNVLFIGQVKNVNEWLNGSDIVVSSSRREGLPVNLIEGMLSGLPAVVTNCRGNRDLVINKENGFIINNEKEFINKVLFLLNNSGTYKYMSTRSRELGELYSIEKIGNEIISIYEETLEFTHLKNHG